MFEPVPGLHGAATAEGRPPPILLFPGIFGEERSFGDLCDALRPDHDIHVVPYPELTARTDLLLDIAASAAFVTSRLRTTAPGEAILIVGYSYGAILAFEVATHLQAGGRSVALLVLLDPALPTTEFDVRRCGPAVDVVGAAPPRPGLAYRSRPIRSALMVLSFLATARTRRRFERRTLWTLRAYARRAWKPRRIACPVLHVMTDQFAPAVAQGWAALCSDVTQIEVAGRHVDLLKGAALGEVTRAVSAALRDAAPDRGGLFDRRVARSGWPASA